VVNEVNNVAEEGGVDGDVVEVEFYDVA